ncbi:pyrimidine 5'-nucleotidase [Vavraia culicis subsp. floridensis]|uniref:Pyrimidine 5'-nucleotidase n=1 Tax=Vavraia culicis (isolate floridensis) TaxID=948595 RepID=L2GUL6_VAVCU|nr:pyrimidine 5'-nucleotidase [Vavraia culicis subsp. floridensis]ELA46983.1 pyrimidine 5'-nucleotidase [Vavraia culicis subsp. floridensis]
MHEYISLNTWYDRMDGSESLSIGGLNCGTYSDVPRTNHVVAANTEQTNTSSAQPVYGNPSVSYRTLIFDLDQTLYPKSSSLQMKIRHRLYKSLMKRNACSYEQAKQMYVEMSVKYGLGYKGMIKEYGMDECWYDELVDFDFGEMLKMDERLNGRIMRIGSDCSDDREDDRDKNRNAGTTTNSTQFFIFTNSQEKYTRRVLKYLNIPHISKIFYTTYFQPRMLCKPERKAFEFVNTYCKGDTYFFDDKMANVEMGKMMGWKCFLIDDDLYDVLGMFDAMG